MEEALRSCLHEDSSVEVNMSLTRRPLRLTLVLLMLTDIQVPDSVSDILRIRKNFSSNKMNDKSREMLEIVKDIKANIHKIPRSDQQDSRNKVLYSSKTFVEEKSLHISSINK